jgi:hypothetical protein
LSEVRLVALVISKEHPGIPARDKLQDLDRGTRMEPGSQAPDIRSVEFSARILPFEKLEAIQPLGGALIDSTGIAADSRGKGTAEFGEGRQLFFTCSNSFDVASSYLLPLGFKISYRCQCPSPLFTVMLPKHTGYFGR